MADGEAAADIHPLLRQRWSPRAFDATHELTQAEVDLLLEAARWAPSAGNSQPWAFVTARRGDAVHERIAPALARSSGVWAPTASVLVLNLCHRWVEDSDLEYSEFAMYDLGQAVAHLTVQAQAMGLFARQFRAFDREVLEATFAIGSGWELATITAIGRPTPVDGPLPQPERRPLTGLRWA